MHTMTLPRVSGEGGVGMVLALYEKQAEKYPFTSKSRRLALRLSGHEVPS